MKRALILGWLALILLVAAQIGLAWLPLGRSHLWFALGVSAAMATIVVWVFMELAKAPRLAMIFAYGGLFWVMVLFALGGSDYATRTETPARPIPVAPADR